MNGWRTIGQICALLLAYEAGRLRDVCLWIDILLSALSMFVLVVANSLGESEEEGGAKRESEVE